ncbi:MAG: YebC/PmpR family DNA-binding transcriptional regulator [Leptospiraceae bacterium]|nr:YebC/PmpR family DNA-binding transcriptional regulator [Leptospiraceae bacterium]MDW7977029.1 YebC/PmpR family DNA-binding transcriptional regulator [Leptospiraceae bacterium]
MAGHSKWANIRHRKESVDKRKGRLFAKLSREIMVAARLGGADPSGNPRLRIAISKARAANMPSDNIEKAIKKGIGETSEQNYEEVLYEAYGPGGVGILIEAMTDKRTRTTPEIKSILSKANASFATPNSVLKFFEKKGQILISKTAIEENKLLEIALENGADDVRIEDENYEVLVDPKEFSNLMEAFNSHGIPVIESGIRYLPIEGTEIQVDAEKADKILKLLDVLENHDDVQAVYHNMLFTKEIEEVLAR